MCICFDSFPGDGSFGSEFLGAGGGVALAHDY